MNSHADHSAGDFESAVYGLRTSIVRACEATERKNEATDGNGHTTRRRTPIRPLSIGFGNTGWAS